MFFSKIWFLVVAAAATVAFGGALVLPKPFQREINKAKAIGLDRTQHNAELLLQRGVRDWLDAAASMARDRKLVEVLEQASDRRGEMASHKARATERLLALTGKLPSDRRPELLIVVEGRGKQIARIGPGDTRFKAGEDGISGYPLVESALRGYGCDDTWNIDGKLYLMVGSPIISRARARYVGAIVIGREINSGYAQRLKSRLGGADLMFFLRGALVANTITSASLSKLPGEYELRRKQIARDGRSTTISVGSDEDAHNVILARLPGESSYHDAFYAMVGPPSPAVGLVDMLGMVEKKDLTSGHWLLLGGGLVVLLVVGLGLMMMEGDRPARRFLRRASELGKGELSRLNDREFTGRFGSIARSMNSALDRAEKRSVTPPKDFGRILGSPAEQGTRPNLRLDPNFSSMPPLAAGVSTIDSLEHQGQSGGLTNLGHVLEVEVGHSVDPRELRKQGPMGRPAPDAEDAETELQASPPSFTPAPPLPGWRAADSFGFEPSFGALGAPEEAPSNRKIRIPESELAPAPPPRHFPAGEMEELPPLDARDEEGDLPELVPSPVPIPVLTPDPAVEEPGLDGEEQKLLGDFEEVFNQFVAVKRQCGENTDNLTLERFEKKLHQNRENLMERYKCKFVKFQVYIKDGKAAIKATPVKE